MEEWRLFVPAIVFGNWQKGYRNNCQTMVEMMLTGQKSTNTHLKMVRRGHDSGIWNQHHRLGTTKHQTQMVNNLNRHDPETMAYQPEGDD